MDRPPPQDLDAEGGVLGTILLYPNEALAVGLRDDDFFSPRHRSIWAAIRALRDAGSMPDLVGVRDELARTGKLEDVGGITYLKALSAEASLSHIDRRVQTVARCSQGRNTITACEHALRGMSESDPAAVLAELRTSLDRIIGSDGGMQFTPFSESLAKFKGRAVDPPISSAVDALDAKINHGYPRGGITLLGGISGSGKTVLALQALRKEARAGRHVLLLSRDQSDDALAGRIWAAESGVQRKALLHDEDAANIEPYLAKWPVHTFQRPFDASSISSAVRLYVSQYGIRLWVLDYLQRVDWPGHVDRRSEAPVLVAEQLASVAQDTHTAGVVVSRTTKPQPGVAVQHQIGGEAGSQNAADLILMVCKLDESEEEGDDRPHGRVIRIVGKRHCADGRCAIMLEGHLDRYRDATKEELAEMRKQYRSRQSPKEF